MGNVDRNEASVPLNAQEAPPGADRYQEVQARLGRIFRDVVHDPNAPRTVVIVPSLSLDEGVLARIAGVHHYEERLLCLLLLLRMPRTRVIYLTSTPIPEAIVDYYLHLLPGIPAQHARARLILLSCHDSSPAPLSAKLLARPRLLRRVLEAIPDASSAYMTCFNVTELERTLALTLGLPIDGCDPSLLHWGSKSGSRKIFREAGIEMPEGFEDLRGADNVADALAELKARLPDTARAVVKLDEGFSGEGNAVFDYCGAPVGAALRSWVRDRLPGLAFEARDMSWELFEDKLAGMGGIVEEFVEGEVKRSPSASARATRVARADPTRSASQPTRTRPNTPAI